MSDIISEFRGAMSSAGLKFSGEILADKRLHRFKPDEGKTDSGWYVLHPDGPVPAGRFGNWSTGLDQKWHHTNGHGDQMSREDRAAFQKRIKEIEEQRSRDEADRWERRSKDAAGYIARLPLAKEHGYLEAKSVLPHGDLRFDAASNFLVLPLEDVRGKVWSYQTIDFMGEKLFMPGARTRGLYFRIGSPDDGPLVVCEGYATGATIHQATGWPVVCAMNCGNLQPVCSALREAHPDKTLVIAADDDRFTEKQGEPYNPGVEKANEAARVVGAKVALPLFAGDSRGTDFNDMAGEVGEGKVRSIFHTLLGVGMGQRISISDLLSFVPSEDKDSVLGDRYLCKGGSCVVIAQTSAGKSSLGMQMAILWALGKDFFGLRPVKPLKSVIVQAENDIGDTAEMFQGILAGMGLVSGGTPERNEDVIRMLSKNLIILRDQTHSGRDFPGYAEKLVEMHKPDLFWIDPLLSFYGNDINDQQAMSGFLRSDLNPISERTGIIWMLLHHTGKPSKEGNKSQKSWTSRDFAYMGIGSSELSNWARAIITVVNTSEDEFKMIMAKRGRRAGLKDEHGNPASDLNLAHSGEGICWKRIPKPKENDEMDDVFSSFSRLIDRPMSATQIVKRAAEKLQRGERTCWKFWDRGEGPLGRLFEKDPNAPFWLPKHLSENDSKPYAD